MAQVVIGQESFLLVGEVGRSCPAFFQGFPAISAAAPESPSGDALVTKEVTFEGKVGGVITDQRSQKLKAGVRLETTINRLEFGVGGDTPTLGDDIEITIRLEMAQQ